MQGRLLPACGGPASHLTFEEIVKAAQAKAHRDTSVALLKQAMRNMAKQAEGELTNSLRGTLASFAGPEVSAQDAAETIETQSVPGTSPDPAPTPVPPAKGLGTDWAPVEADQATLGLHEGAEKLSHALAVFQGMTELEKQAFLSSLVRGGIGAARSGMSALLGAGRGAAGALAARGGAAGRVGRFLQRPVQSPLSLARTGPGGVHIQARSPLGAGAAPKAPPPGGGPYRTSGTPPPVPRDAGKIPDLTRHAKVEGGPVKPKSLTGALLPGALLLGAGYGIYKGVPKALNWASSAANSPMAYNFGQQQYQYGYTPEGQAQF